MRRVCFLLIGISIAVSPIFGADLPPWALIEVDLHAAYLERVKGQPSGHGDSPTLYPGIRWDDGKVVFAPDAAVPTEKNREKWGRLAAQAAEQWEKGGRIPEASVDALINGSILTGDKGFAELVVRRFERLWAGPAAPKPTIPSGDEGWELSDGSGPIFHAQTALRILKIRRAFGIRSLDFRVTEWANSLDGSGLEDAAVFLLARDASGDDKWLVRSLRSALLTLRRPTDPPLPPLARGAEGNSDDAAIGITGAVLFGVVSGGAAVLADEFPWVEITPETEEGSSGLSTTLAMVTTRKENTLKIEFANVSDRACRFTFSLPHGGRPSGPIMTYRCKVVGSDESRVTLSTAARTAGDIRFDVPARPGSNETIRPAPAGETSSASPVLKVFLSEEDIGNARDSLRKTLDEQLEKSNAFNGKLLRLKGLELEKRKEEIRRDLILALGGLPERTSLNPRYAGTVPGHGYRIEKWIVESRPGFFVTLNVYVPEPSRPALPAVIVVPGGDPEGKSSKEAQTVCIALARAGHAALVFDPPGRGERAFSSGSTGESEIRKAALQCLLSGGDLAGHAAWDALRMTDFLLGQPGIDGRRLAVIGMGSGGDSALSFAALDDRVRVVAISRSDRSPYRDPESILSGQIRGGYDDIGRGLVISPRPLLVETEEAEETGYEPLKAAYGLQGATPSFRQLSSDSQRDSLRKEAVNWINRWLRGDREIADPATLVNECTESKELFCTPGGRVGDLGGETLYSLNQVRSRKTAADCSDLSDATRCREYILDTEKRIQDLLGIAEGLPRFTTELRGGFRTSDVALERVILRRDDKVPLPGLLLVPTDTPRREPPVIYLGSRAKIGTPGERSDIWAPILKAGYPIFSFDPRGTGETEPAKDKERIPLEMIELESSLFAERVKDVLVAIAFVTGSQDGTARNVILIGEGTGGLLALHAAALSDRVSAVAAIRTIDRYDSLAEFPDVETPLSDVVPGVLSRYDLQDVVSTIAPRPVFLVNTVGGKGSPLRSSEIEAIYECPRKMADHLGEFFKHRSVPNAKIPKLVSDWIEKTRS